eukprot:scaffold22748_cov182-Cylindrotheca_fusiformis.AAC.3
MRMPVLCWREFVKYPSFAVTLSTQRCHVFKSSKNLVVTVNAVKHWEIAPSLREQSPFVSPQPCSFKSCYGATIPSNTCSHCSDFIIAIGSTMTDSPKLPFPPTVTQLYSRALWDPRPTTTLKSEKQLAYALGYPSDWRVERKIAARDGKSVIRDQIHAMFGKGKKQSYYTWFHHAAAQRAALQLEEEGNINGSHLLPPIPLYTKGDVVEVNYEGKWYASTITKRKKMADLFVYSVVYHEDGATQDEVAEEDIRPGEDPSTLAVELGFTADWKASRKGARYILTSPTGERFTTKKAAMKFFKEEQDVQVVEEQDVGDPPWRLEGHEWIGRRVHWTSFHKVSGSRKVKVEQVGTIEGYIDKTDVDKEGNPGFISEITGKPADLFHVVFPEDNHHPYPSHCLSAQDLEEQEVEKSLIEETESAKRKRLEMLKGKKRAKN